MRPQTRIISRAQRATNTRRVNQHALHAVWQTLATSAQLWEALGGCRAPKSRRKCAIFTPKLRFRVAKRAANSKRSRAKLLPILRKFCSARAAIARTFSGRFARVAHQNRAEIARFARRNCAIAAPNARQSCGALAQNFCRSCANFAAHTRRSRARFPIILRASRTLAQKAVPPQTSEPTGAGAFRGSDGFRFSPQQAQGAEASRVKYTARVPPGKRVVASQRGRITGRRRDL